MPHLIRNITRHTGIHLIKDNGGQRRKTSDHRLDTKHQSGDLTARSCLRNRLYSHTLIG